MCCCVFLQSLLAPVLASCSLFGLYLLIKYLPNFSLQTFLDAYFWLLGTVAISNAARPVISKLSSPLKLQRFSVAVEIPPGLLDDEQQQQQEEGSVQNLLISPADVAAVLLGAGLASYELLGHHTNFTLNNMVSWSHVICSCWLLLACCLQLVVCWWSAGGDERPVAVATGCFWLCKCCERHTLLWGSLQDYNALCRRCTHMTCS